MKPIIVRGGGDLATGTILRLSMAGYQVIVLECSRPTAIRREVSFCEAVYYGQKTVEGITCVRVDSIQDALTLAAPGHPVLFVDEKAESIRKIKPDILVDSIIAKRNLGTTIDMAGLVIGIGPGFEAGVDVHAVIETKRGHDLGRIIRSGTAVPNTGIPGNICGFSAERVIHAPAEGILHNIAGIADLVDHGQIISLIEGKDGVTEVAATLTGVLRGILPDGFYVNKGLKMADIDPRTDEKKNCYTVSDKARCIAGSVLELVCSYEKMYLS